MSSSSVAGGVCTTCGSRIVTTVSGDLGCLSCLLRTGADDEPDSTAATPGMPDSFGAYVIQRREDGSPHELGRGAMGITFLAEDVSLQRPVALKIIKTDLAHGGADARERFMREARAAAALRHPNVATVYQFGLDDETGQFYAMELIEGETLEERVRRTGPLDVGTTIEIARQVTAALGAAEERGLVHRDLKPGNIMIVSGAKNAEVAVKVIDFGVAKVLGEAPEARYPTHGGFVGTPAFASPEQLEGEAVDARSDIYSLGATLWFLLTSETPSPDLGVGQLKAAHVPPKVISLLTAMRATAPAARPSVKELGARLAAIQRSRLPALFFALAGLLIAVLGATYYLYPASTLPARDAASFSKSIAVLPFDDLSHEADSANFADGVQDDLLTDLAHIADLKVVSRTSALQYPRGEPRNLREIGRQLGVAYVVEGAVRRVGRQVRVSAQLIDARTDLHQWAETYDRPLSDIFALQSEIARSIADQLHAKIAPAEKTQINEAPTHDLVAFKHYTRAKSLIEASRFSRSGEADLEKAVQLLGNAVARDPKFVLAYCQLAAADDAFYLENFDHTPRRLSLGDAAIEAASRLQPEAGEVHLARARHLYQGYRAFGPALAELAIARITLPNDPEVSKLFGFIYRHEGKWVESTQQFERALVVDPRNSTLLHDLVTNYESLRRYPEMASMLERILAIEPEDLETRFYRAMIDVDWRADTRPLHDLLAAFLAEHPSRAPEFAAGELLVAWLERDNPAIDRALGVSNVMLGVGPVNFSLSMCQGLMAQSRGQKTAAESAFRMARKEQEDIITGAKIEVAPPLCVLALIDAFLGNKEEAIKEGRRAVQLLPVTADPIDGPKMIEFLAVTYAWVGEPSLACDQLDIATKLPGTLSYGQLRLNPLWDPLRGNPRFEKIVASLAPEAANSPSSGRPNGDSNRAAAQNAISIEVLATFDYPGEGNSTSAQGINLRGDIAGNFIDAHGIERGFIRYADGTFSDPIVEPKDNVGFTALRDINNSGTVGGTYKDDQLITHAFLLSGTTFTDLKIPNSFLFGINDANDAVGYVITPAWPYGTSFIYAHGHTDQIVIPNQTTSGANGVNKAGEMVGSYLDNLPRAGVAGIATRPGRSPHRSTRLGPSPV